METEREKTRAEAARSEPQQKSKQPFQRRPINFNNLICMTQLFAVLVFLVSLFSFEQNEGLFHTSGGEVSFISEAPLETIKAASKNVKGLVNTTDNTFAFSIPNRSFHGFNSALQEEHFNENYMHSDKFPNSTFSGKIIEDVDLSKPGDYDVRAKGMLDIHGVKQERIIKCKVHVEQNEINVKSDFVVLLEDHQINIPRIVNEKIFPEIKVSVNLTLQPK